MTVEGWLAFEGELIIFQTDQWHSLERICRADAKGIHKNSPVCRSISMFNNRLKQELLALRQELSSLMQVKESLIVKCSA